MNKDSKQLSERLTDNDSKLLFICFLVGAAGIIILKLLEVNQFIVTACPVVIMFFYAGYAGKNYKAESDPEVESDPKKRLGRAGDNLYYLGFLYTLVSLAMSLFEFSLIDESTGKITQIITNFGIAIFSTIFGIFFRVFFNQSEDKESDLSTMISDLGYQIGKFSGFRTELEQILKETGKRQREAVTRFTKSVEESRERFQASIADLVDTVSSFKERASKLDSAANVVANAMSDSATDFADTVEKSQKQFQASMSDSAADFAKTVEKNQEQLQTNMSDSANHFAETIEKSREQLQASMSDSATDFADTVKKSREQLQDSIADFANTVSNFKEQASNATDRERFNLFHWIVSIQLTALIALGTIILIRLY